MATETSTEASPPRTVVRHGFAIIPKVFSSTEVAHLKLLLGDVIDKAPGGARPGAYGVRNLLEVVPELGRLARSPTLRSLVQAVLGQQPLPVRSLLFDKFPSANWKVPWHQDLSIAVKKKLEVKGFGPLSIKGDVTHVQPPAQVLESMLTVQIHLDDCAESNGPLRVIPGSHLRGRVSAAALIEISREPAVSCIVPAGGVLLMRPLLVHASSASRVPRHRRVIHLEFAACGLPGGLEWFAGSAPLPW